MGGPSHVLEISSFREKGARRIVLKPLADGDAEVGRGASETGPVTTHKVVAQDSKAICGAHGPAVHKCPGQEIRPREGQSEILESTKNCSRVLGGQRVTPRQRLPKGGPQCPQGITRGIREIRHDWWWIGTMQKFRNGGKLPLNGWADFGVNDAECACLGVLGDRPQARVARPQRQYRTPFPVAIAILVVADEHV